MSLDTTAIEDALGRWVADAINVEYSFAHQNAPKVKGQSALINLSQIVSVGHPETISTDVAPVAPAVIRSIENEYSNVYNLMVSINIFRLDAFSKMISLRDSLLKITVKDSLWAAGLGFINSSEVRDIPDVIDKHWEERAQMDFFFYARSLESETINEIKEVELTNQIDSSTTTIP